MENVLLITIDALRHDHLPFMGYKRNTTPFLHKIAKEGTIFNRAYSNSCWTAAAFPSIFSSDYPVSGDKYGIENRLTIQEILRDHGYQTIAFNSNPYLSRHYKYDKGFGYFEDYLDKIYLENESTNSKASIRKLIGKFMQMYENLCIEHDDLFSIHNLLRKTKNLLRPVKYNVPYIDALTLTKDVISRLKNQSKEPFFLWVHYMDPHRPHVYAPLSNNIQDRSVNKSELKKRLNRTNSSERICVNYLADIINRYDSRIRYVDHAIEHLFAHIGRNYNLDNTLVIITADHGEEFLDHGNFGHFPKLYEELIHVPLIIKGPDIPKRKKIDKLVQHLDIAPTILDMLGISVPQSFLGKNLFEETERRGIISEVSNELNKIDIDRTKLKVAYRSDEWKYIYNENAGDELYNLKIDPKETKNLLYEKKEKAEEFKSRVLQHTAMDEKYFIRLNERRTKKLKNKIKELKRKGRI